MPGQWQARPAIEGSVRSGPGRHLAAVVGVQVADLKVQLLPVRS